jgi:COP9 signalosome complex subunit 6
MAPMEVDSPHEEERRTSVHPLAIVNMSDQYTRITCGGSPLTPDSPVVGLLFGTDHDHHWQIKDADDVPVDASESATTLIGLHQAVFPQHRVLGWYRVTSDDSEPLERDLVLTKQLAEHYQRRNFVFGLLQVPRSDAITAANAHDEVDQDELPLTLYQVHGGSALVAIPAWTLTTSDAEKIAVERVVREKTKHPTDSRYVQQTKQTQQSVENIQHRVDVLVQFLEDTVNGTLPHNPALLRKVQSLVWHLGPVAATRPPRGLALEKGLQQLAILAQTVHAVQIFTDKVRVLAEANSGVPGGRPIGSHSARRFAA